MVTAEVGVVFCSVVLVTGPLWARPVWGIWWTWDVRLTSTLVLWLIYISYLMLRRFSTSGQTPVLAAALAIFGALDVPLVYFSIWIFRTQHPQPVIGGGGSIDPRMLHVLLINWLAFLCFAEADLLVPLSSGDIAKGSRRSSGAGSAARTIGAHDEFPLRRLHRHLDHPHHLSGNSGAALPAPAQRDCTIEDEPSQED